MKQTTEQQKRVEFKGGVTSYHTLFVVKCQALIISLFLSYFDAQQN